MKKIVFATVSALALAAIAADSTQFGVLTVPSSAAETIVSVPWLESTTDAQNVSVSNLVLTAGLNVNDELMLYTGSGYACWILKQSSDVKYWEPGTTVTTEGSKTAATADQAKIARGSAIILKRGGTIADSFYVMGKPFSGTETAVTLAAGTSDSPTYSLVAPPSVSAVDVNTGITWSGITKYDSLMLSDGSSLVWNNSDSKWYKRVKNEWTSSDISIPAGTGAWFVGKSEGPKSFKIN